MLILLTLIVCTHAASSYSEKKILQARLHLENVYGKGLLGMFDNHGLPTRDGLKKSNSRPHLSWINIGGIDID